MQCPEKMGQKRLLLRTVIFVTLLTPSLLQPVSIERIETVSSSSPSSSSSSLSPDDEKEIKELYEAVDVMATKYHNLNCSPTILLGFDDKESTISWHYRVNGSTFMKKGYLGNYLLSSDYPSLIDQGNYTCTLTSSNGTRVKKTFGLCITKSDDVRERPFKGSISETTYEEEGQSVSFNCRAYVGSPRCLNPYKYSVLWSYGNGSVVSLDSSEEFNVTQTMTENGMMTGRLEIKKVQKSHYGIYFCHVKNQYGSLSLNVTLTDEVPPAVMRDRHLWAACIFLLLVGLFLPITICYCRHVKVELALYIRQKTYDHSAAAVASNAIPQEVKFPPLQLQEDRLKKLRLIY